MGRTRRNQDWLGTSKKTAGTYCPPTELSASVTQGLIDEVIARLGNSIRRFNGLSLGHERTRSSPLRSPPVPQLGRNARREEKLSSAGCCKRAPDTSAAARPREPSGARRHRTRWEYRRTWGRPRTSDCPNNRASTR